MHRNVDQFSLYLQRVQHYVYMCVCMHMFVCVHAVCAYHYSYIHVEIRSVHDKRIQIQLWDITVNKRSGPQFLP